MFPAVLYAATYMSLYRSTIFRFIAWLFQTTSSITSNEAWSTNCRIYCLDSSRCGEEREEGKGQSRDRTRTARIRCTMDLLTKFPSREIHAIFLLTHTAQVLGKCFSHQRRGFLSPRLCCPQVRLKEGKVVAPDNHKV